MDGDGGCPVQKILNIVSRRHYKVTVILPASKDPNQSHPV